MPVVARQDLTKYLFTLDEQNSYYSENAVHLTTAPGYHIFLDLNTQILTSDGYKWSNEIKNGDILLIQTTEEYIGNEEHSQKAHLYGCFSATKTLWETHLQRSKLDPRVIPSFIWYSDKFSLIAYLKGLYYAHGKFEHTSEYFHSSLDFEGDIAMIEQVQGLLLCFGILSHREDGKLITKDWQATDILTELIELPFGFDTVEGFDQKPKKRVLQTKEQYKKSFELPVKIDFNHWGGDVLSAKSRKIGSAQDHPDIINGISVLHRTL